MSTNKDIIVYISDGYADWELAYVCPELNAPDSSFTIKTLSSSNEAVVSMAGLSVTPDYSITDLTERGIDASNYAMLLLCGGFIWKDKDYKLPELNPIIDLFLQNDILVSSICDATTYLASNGYLDNVDHTGNSLEYLTGVCPNYKGSSHYIEKQCVSSSGIITANGSATLEFASEILKYLQVKPDEQVDGWYLLHKNGYYSN